MEIQYLRMKQYTYMRNVMNDVDGSYLMAVS
jgi:hypothetical protein